MRIKNIFYIFLFFISIQTVCAQDLEVTGLIADHTITAEGHDFYRQFSEKWQEAVPGNFMISEKPTARSGSIISIRIDRDLLYRTILFPNKSKFNQEVDKAIAGVSNALKQRNINKSLLNTGDLTKDEL